MNIPIEVIRSAFYKTFHNGGEFWFDYLGTPEENNRSTLAYWNEFYENLISEHLESEIERVRKNE